jgi:Concanavalin A-like lectin/glucanases superfamily
MQQTQRPARLRVALVALVAAAPLAATPVATLPTASAAPANQAIYQMNEAPGATTMIDSSGNGLNGTINQAGLDTGVVFGGATGYLWPFRSPTAPPASPERVIRVPDNSKLDPLGDTFTVEIRYRTTNSFGNIMQKGQSTSTGGQWKIQNPGGRPSCLFKSSAGQASVRSVADLSDGQWHVLRCVRTPSRVSMYVDGAFVNQKNGATGTINNSIPLTIGGKLNCDQITVTCDYFSGGIDYVKITRGT